VIVSPGRPFFAGEPSGPFLRLTYAAEPPDRLAAAVERLRTVLAREGETDV
jgi:DNA-binding transcriptional MocR family regulator